MISSKEIVCPNNLLDVAHQKKGISAGIVNAGKSVTMMSIMDAVNENLIVPIFIGDKNEIESCALKLNFESDINIKEKKISNNSENLCWALLDKKAERIAITKSSLLGCIFQD